MLIRPVVLDFTFELYRYKQTWLLCFLIILERIFKFQAVVNLLTATWRCRLAGCLETTPYLGVFAKYFGVKADPVIWDKQSALVEDVFL